MRAIWADIRSRRFLGRFAKESLAALGLLGVIVGLIDALFEDALDGRGTVAVVLVVAVSVAWGLLRSWPRPVEHQYSAPNITIRVIRGDLLEQPGHLVIGATDTFDTAVPGVISPRSLQGQALDRLWGGDAGQLDQELARALADVTPSERIAKPGKTQRYPIGTVASVPQGGRRLLFVAYSRMNEHNQARACIEGVWASLLSLWEAVSRDCNGGSVAVPAIGGGQARIAQILPPQDSIRFIAFSFLLASRRERLCDELCIVVLPDMYDRLDRLELQAFLDSLEMS